MEIFLELNKEAFNKKTFSYNEVFLPYVQNMKNIIDKNNDDTIFNTFKDYINIVQWPIRKLEYSYILDNILPYINDGTKLLDAGCGVTPVPFLFGSHCKNSYAVDFSTDDIELMKRLKSKNEFIGSENVEFLVENICKMGFEDNSFDLISSVSVLEHIDFPSYIDALSELYRVLKPGGRLVCTMDFWLGESRKHTLGSGGFTKEDVNELFVLFDRQIDISTVENLNNITQDHIQEFWELYYDSDISKETSREYLAIGFIIEKDIRTDTIIQTLNNFNAYKNKNALDVVYSRNNKVAFIEKDRRARLDIIEKLDANNRVKDSHINEIEQDRVDRLNQINILTKNIEEIERDREDRLQQINILHNYIDEIEKDREARLRVISDLSSKNDSLTYFENKIQSNWLVKCLIKLGLIKL